MRKRRIFYHPGITGIPKPPFGTAQLKITIDQFIGSKQAGRPDVVIRH
jgi:hypothetical protein